MRIAPKNYILIVSLLLFLAGISLPLFTMSKFYVFNNTFSIISGGLFLIKEFELFLAFVIIGFSIVLPLFKYWLMFNYLQLSNEHASQRLKLANKVIKISKWSMADVFLIGVIAATVKFSGVASIEVHVGVFVFGLSVLSSMYLTHLVLKSYQLVEKVTQDVP